MSVVKGLLTGMLSLALASAAEARIRQFVVPLDGTQEVAPNVGDPDGTGTAYLTIDDSTSPPTISWNIVTNNIALPISADHIHQGVAGANGSVRVDFGGQLSGSGLQDPDLVNVIASPTGWYVNVHNSAHPGGAIRGQMSAPIPAASTYGLAVLGVLLTGAAVTVFHKRRRQRVFAR